MLLELDQFQSDLNGSYSALNQTTHDLYSRSIDYHFEQLFSTLFPYISKSPKKPRTFKQLSARYTRPKGIMSALPTFRHSRPPASLTASSSTVSVSDSIPCGNDQVRSLLGFAAFVCTQP